MNSDISYIKMWVVCVLVDVHVVDIVAGVTSE